MTPDETELRSQYLYRAALIVPAAGRENADALAPQVTGQTEGPTYTIPLSSDGGQTVTHYGCCTAVSSPMLAVMQAALSAGALPGVLFYRWESEGGTGTLLATNAPSAAQITGQPAWSWAASLEDAGLVVASTPLPGGPS